MCKQDLEFIFINKDSLMVEEALNELLIPNKEIQLSNSISTDIKSNNERESKLKVETVKNHVRQNKDDKLLESISSVNKSYYCLII